MNRRWMGFGLCALLCAASGCASSTKSANSAGDSLNVSKVVMYQSGVGYVERVGEVKGSSLTLNIRTDQINDILKSLTVIDRSKGRPVSMTLPVDRQTLDALSQIPEQITNGGLLALLRAFRGANVTIKSRGKTVTGRIVGVERMTVAPQNRDRSAEPREDWRVTVLDRNDALHPIELSKIKSVNLHDKNLSSGLAKSLDISLNEGDWKKVSLTIQLEGDRNREVALSYIVAMPTWKPAYRLILSDDGRSVLQGWAVITNVTGSDWDNISFSLVSGQPMSFTYDLYTPHFLIRPDLSGQAQQVAVAPRIQTSGFGSAAGGSAREVQARAASRPAAPAAMAKQSADMRMMESAVYADEYYDADNWAYAESEMAAPMMDSRRASISDAELLGSFESMATANQVGSFDEYRLASGLTVPDGSTSLVNLIHYELPAVEARLFDRTGSLETQSYQTVQLQNSSGVSLEPGPITIYRGSTFVGEGYLSRTAAGATAYVTFANESRVSVRRDASSFDENYRVVRVNGGRMTYAFEQVSRHNFDVTNNTNTSATVLVRVPRSGSMPVELPESVVIGESEYTLPIAVDANATTSKSFDFRVRRESTVSMRSDGAVEALERGLKENTIPAGNVEHVRRFVELYRANATVTEELKLNNALKKDLDADQRNISQSLADIKSINTSSAAKLREQLIDRQRANERKLVDLTGKLAELQVRQSEITVELRTLEREIRFDIQ